ncbi:MAG TPA: hypothetical protein VGX27_14085 [Candidatus Dormibacteraeota bacterium]|nr:hypothetical protein [Candidatus Dormibacteraeota bacterium]
MVAIRWRRDPSAAGSAADPLWLRPINGRDEEFLFENASAVPAATRVTELLARCLSRPSDHAVELDAVRRLTVGRREGLLLALRGLTLGDRISCILVCPECDRPMDADLSVSALHREAGAEEQVYEVAIEQGGESWRARFRLPIGADQEAVADLARTDAEAAGLTILQRCLIEVVHDGANTGKSEASPELLEAVELAMEAADPQAETRLRSDCPECGAQFVSVFDAADYFIKEVAASNRDLYRDVHALALSYHWSEEAILTLSHGRRQMYLKLLAESTPLEP